jgi:hypothetical protein
LKRPKVDDGQVTQQFPPNSIPLLRRIYMFAVLEDIEVQEAQLGSIRGFLRLLMEDGSFVLTVF